VILRRLFLAHNITLMQPVAVVCMPVIANKQKPDTAVLADATDRLLRATKKKTLRQNGRIEYAKLTWDGFSAAMIERLKAL
jgi:hypothetical protein